jgi:hypothetical protein
MIKINRELEFNNTTEQQYYEDGGVCCPVCKSTEITSTGDLSIDIGIASMGICCRKCEATWNDEYILAGFSKLSVDS